MSVRANLTGRARMRRVLADAQTKTETATGDAIHEGATLIAQTARQRVRALRDPDRPSDSPLADSIGVKDGETGVFVTVEAPYAPFVEFGTRHMPAQPFLAPAIAEHRGALRDRTARAIQETLTKTSI